MRRLRSRSCRRGKGGTPHTGAFGATDDRDASDAPYGNYFVATYAPFPRWTAIAVDEYGAILDRAAVLKNAAPLGLYVHIPFCVDRCRYCYYLSYEGDDRGDLGRYVDALIAELGG